MAQYDGSIRINTKIDSKEASVQLRTLENRIVKTADKVASLRSKMDALKGVQIPTQEYKSIQTDISKAEKELQKLIEKQSQMEQSGKISGTAWDTINRKIQASKEYIEYAKEELQGLVDTGKAFTLGEDSQKFADLSQQLKYAENDLSVLVQKEEESRAKTEGVKSSYVSLGESIRQAFTTMGRGLISIPIATVKKGIEGLKAAFTGLGNIAKKAFSGITSIIKKAASSMLSLGRSTKSANGFFQGGLKSILRYGLGIRSLYALVNKLRSAIKEGFSNLYNDANMEGFRNQVDSLKASLTTLKNAFAAAFKPLVEIAIPYIQQAIAWVTKLADAFGQLMAAITGQKTYTKAIKQTTAALKDEKKAAEGYLSPLDEINKFQTSKDSGTDSGASEIMFEGAPISERFADISQWIKDMWANADFSELGALLGQKLKNALSNIDWNPIKEAAAKIGKSIGTLINGSVETDGLGDSIGRTIGEMINTGIAGINAFLDNTHWDSVGIFLGEGLNSIVNTVNFESIGHLLSAKINAIFETISNFSTTFGWSEFGTSLSNGLATFINDIDTSFIGSSIGETIKGLLDTFIAFVENTDWKELGNTVAQKISDFFTSIDWSRISDRLFEGLGAAFAGIGLFIWGLIEDAWNSVVEWWQEVAYEDGQFTMKGLLNGILDVFSAIGTWISEHIFKPFMDGFKKVFGIHSPSTVMEEMGKYLMQGLLNGITSLIGSVIAVFSSIKEKVSQKWEEIKTNTSQKWNEIKQGLSEKWEGIKSSAKAIFEKIGSNIKSAWDNAKQNTESAWNNMKSRVSTITADISEKVSRKFGDIKKNLNDFSSAAKSIWSDTWAAMKEKASSMLSSIKDIISSAFSWISEKVSDIINKLSGVSSKASSVSGAASSAFSTSRVTSRMATPAFASLADIEIPRLATGTVIPANREFLAVLGDQKRGTNIEAPLDTIKQANRESLIEVLSELGLTGGNGGSQTIVIKQYLDRTQLAEAIIKEGKLQQMSTGRNIFMLGLT